MDATAAVAVPSEGATEIHCDVRLPAIRCDLRVERPGEPPVVYVGAALHGAGGLIVDRGPCSSSLLRIAAELVLRARRGETALIYVEVTAARDSFVEAPARCVRVLRAWSRGA